MRTISAFVAVFLFSVSGLLAEEVFSGPQVGETLAPVVAQRAIAEEADQSFDLIKRAGGKPVVIVFVHKVTRPSVGLTRILMNYAAKRAEDGLTAGVVFLTDDPTETKNWMRRAARALPKNVPIGVSIEGQDGPGAYGLNRNVALTVLVGDKNKVTANFALVQPSVQTDALKVATAMVKILGGEVPTLDELGANRRARPARRRSSPRSPGNNEEE
jgi:hypothetical protein